MFVSINDFRVVFENSNYKKQLDTRPSVKYWMQPEFSAESRKYPQTDTPNSFKVHIKQGKLLNKKTWKSKDIVAYDSDGKIVGVFSVAIEGPETGAFKITVREDAQRQGWGSKLLDEAQRQGVDIKNSIQHNSFSSSGRNLLHSWLSKNESIFNQEISDEDYIKAFKAKINNTRNNLLKKIEQNPNFCFVLKTQMKFDCTGEDGKCETNSWSFVKNKLEQGITHFYPVGGYFFQNESFFPTEHWWVYDQQNNQHIELSPMDPRMQLKCYAGVINYDIQEQIKNSNNFYDVDFFKGGNVYKKYFESFKNDEQLLYNLAQQFYQENPIPEDNEFYPIGDCIEQTNLFINWANKKGYKNRFMKLHGAPKNPKFGDPIWMHSVVLDTQTNNVIDLTHAQFDENKPIVIYSKDKFRQDWPHNVNDDGMIENLITSIDTFRKIYESKKKNDGIDLVIVDVQEQFKEYFSERYLVELQKYCEDYKRVFQIWDSKDSDKPDYVFPNQVSTYEKQYGQELSIDNVEQFFTQAMWPEIKKKLENVPDEGDMFETINGEAWVYIENKHKWFLCPKEICNLFKDFVRQQRKIVLVGGATKECYQDIMVTMKAFGVNVSADTKFLYSKEGSYWSNKYQPTEEDLQAIKDKENKHLKKKEKKS